MTTMLYVLRDADQNWYVDTAISEGTYRQAGQGMVRWGGGVGGTRAGPFELRESTQDEA